MKNIATAPAIFADDMMQPLGLLDSVDVKNDRCPVCKCKNLDREDGFKICPRCKTNFKLFDDKAYVCNEGISHKMISNKTARIDMRTNTVYEALCTAEKKLNKNTLKNIYHKHEAQIINMNVEVSDEDIYNFILNNINLFLEDILYALFDLTDITLDVPDNYIEDGINQFITSNQEKLAHKLVAADENEDENKDEAPAELESAVAENVYKAAKELFYDRRDGNIMNKLDAIYDKHMDSYRDVFYAHGVRPGVDKIEQYLTENYTGDDILSDIVLALLSDEHVMDITDNESILTLAADMLLNDKDIIHDVAECIEGTINYN